MVIARGDSATRAERVRRARSVVGKFESVEADLSENHDKYLEEDFG